MILTGVIRAFFIFPSPEYNMIIQKFPKDFIRITQRGCLFEIAITFYLIFFGVLLSSAEFKFRPILKYLGFLPTPLGKGLICLFVGGILQEDWESGDLTKLIAIKIFATGTINCIIGFYRLWQDARLLFTNESNYEAIKTKDNRDYLS
jgi:hypothetical protein